jgi:hypothetical protein
MDTGVSVGKDEGVGERGAFASYPDSHGRPSTATVTPMPPSSSVGSSNEVGVPFLSTRSVLLFIALCFGCQKH